MRTIALLAAFVCMLAIEPMLAQSSSEIKSKEGELRRLRNEIDALEKKLKDSERRERSTLQRIDDLEQQSTLLRQLIRKLREEEKQINADIAASRGSIRELEGQVSTLTSHYAGWVRSIYKNGRVYDLELLLSSKSLNQFTIRLQYMKRFSDQRVQDLAAIVRKKENLEKKNRELQAKLESERRLLAEKTREERRLGSSYAERQSVLRRVRRDKKSYQTELNKRAQAVRKVEQLMAALIDRERVRKQREEENRRRALADARPTSVERTLPKLPTPSGTSGSFAKRRGKLRWPVSTGRVQTKFGTVTHPVLKTVTQSSGIDIATSAGSAVHSVADGEVSLISFIPGFGNVLIVNHFDGYRTVYAHLADILVAEDQRVSEGMEIARSGETVSGSFLHFELWHEKVKHNPETWLAKR